jgi:hypothetical protein
MILNQCDAPSCYRAFSILPRRAIEKRALYASGRRTINVVGELAAVPAKDNGRPRPAVGFAVREVSKQRLRLQGSGANKGFADDRHPDN